MGWSGVAVEHPLGRRGATAGCGRTRKFAARPPCTKLSCVDDVPRISFKGLSAMGAGADDQAEFGQQHTVGVGAQFSTKLRQRIEPPGLPVRPAPQLVARTAATHSCATPGGLVPAAARLPARSHAGLRACPKVPRETCGAARCHRKSTLDPSRRPHHNQARAIELPILRQTGRFGFRGLSLCWRAHRRVRGRQAAVPLPFHTCRWITKRRRRPLMSRIARTGRHAETFQWH